MSGLAVSELSKSVYSIEPVIDGIWYVVDGRWHICGITIALYTIKQYLN